ncbi:MAG: hypothetical protein Q7S60_03605 [bacterium]|nr:hypothetical protein [bacterium]
MQPRTIDISQAATGLGDIGRLRIDQIIVGLIRLLVIGAAVVFFIWLILGGIKWISSSGDKTKMEEARGQITAALVGLVIVFSAWAIAQLIKTLFGVDFTSLVIPSLRDIGNPSQPDNTVPAPGYF